jgi:hypothetical protein
MDFPEQPRTLLRLQKSGDGVLAVPAWIAAFATSAHIRDGRRVKRL